MALLYGPNGEEIDTERLKEIQATPTPVVRNIYSNLYPATGLDPDKLMMIFRQADFGDPFLFLELAEEMEEHDSHYLGVLNKRKHAAASLEFNIHSDDKSKTGQKIVAFLNDVLQDTSSDLQMRDLLFDTSDALGKGFSVNEIIWDTQRRWTDEPGAPASQYWVPSRVEWRDPRWFMFDWISGQQVLVRTLRTDGQTINVRKQVVDQRGHDRPRPAHAPKNMNGAGWNWNGEAAAIGIQPLTAPLEPYHFITYFGKVKTGLPIRSGIARCAGWAYYFKNMATKDWAVFAERFGQPLRVGVFPPGATAEDRNALLSVVGRIGAEGAGILPSSMKIDFATPPTLGAGATMYDTYVRYLEDLLSKLILGSTLGTQIGDVGSKAAAQTHAGIEQDIIQGDGERLAGCITRCLVRPLVDLNFGEQRRYPSVRLGMPDDSDTRVFVQNISDLVDHHMPVGVQQIYDKLGLVAPEKDEVLLKPKAGGPGGKGAAPGADDGDDDVKGGADDDESSGFQGRRIRLDGARVALNRVTPTDKTMKALARFGHPSELITTFARSLAKDKTALNGIRGPIMRAIDQAVSYEDLRRRLATLATEMDPLAFHKQLATALNVARLAGRLTETAHEER